MPTSDPLDTLTTDDCLWRPASAGLPVQRDANGTSRVDGPDREVYDLGPSSLGWLTSHLGFWIGYAWFLHGMRGQLARA